MLPKTGIAALLALLLPAGAAWPRMQDKPADQAAQLAPRQESPRELVQHAMNQRWANPLVRPNLLM
jgi:hypothetical protein